MVSEGKLANAFCGKSARACDNCIKKRARWYCAADDAFLCQSCDSSVHSANTLARRHERVRLKIASLKSFDDNSKPRLHVSTSWHKGFTRKARTPRQNKKNAKFGSDREPESVRGTVIDDGNNNISNNPLHLVPEIENSNEENDEQLLYRVPIFEPFVSELCNSNEPVSAIQGENKGQTVSNDHSFGEGMMATHLQGFLPSEMDLAEFAADVESLLGKGLEDESFDMKDLGLSDSKECHGLLVKVEDEEVMNASHHHHHDHQMFDVGRETFELNFDYDSPIATTAVDDDEKAEEENKEIILEPMVMINNISGFDSSKMILRLDYEGVISAWDDQKSPWTTRERPNFDSDSCWPHCMGTCGRVHVYGEISMVSSGHAAAMGDGGREARVSRYREKRRTRLFSKKIRYEVRKLNAEKRPRMKGRFVKRSSSNLFT